VKLSYLGLIGIPGPDPDLMENSDSMQDFASFCIWTGPNVSLSTILFLSGVLNGLVHTWNQFRTLTLLPKFSFNLFYFLSSAEVKLSLISNMLSES